MNLLMQNQTHILTLVKKLMIKIQNLKLVIILEYQNTRMFCQRLHTPSWSEEGFVIKKVENTVPWTYVINDLNGKKL